MRNRKNKYPKTMIKCDNFSKKDWEENYIEILEQVQAELLLEIREMIFDVKNFVLQIKEKE